MNAIAKQESTALAERSPQFDLSPKTFDQALTFAGYLADSDMVPKDFKGKPGNCLIAIQWGAELGLKPLQAMQNLAIINGRPSLWGDAVIALVRSSPACEYVLETQSDASATCKVKRRGEPEQERTFSMADAQAAGLKGKQGPWSQYPKRMMQMRARAFALRDVFPDVLRGLPVAEEVMDAPKDMGRADVVAVPAVDAGLLHSAEAAAVSGVVKYQAFWKAAGAENRKALAGEHERLKGVAKAADAERTVETPAPAEPAATQAQDVITLAMVMGKLRAAANLDALDVALDWANALTDPAEIKLAEALYSERQAAMGA